MREAILWVYPLPFPLFTVNCFPRLLIENNFLIPSFSTSTSLPLTYAPGDQPPGTVELAFFFLFFLFFFPPILFFLFVLVPHSGRSPTNTTHPSSRPAQLSPPCRRLPSLWCLLLDSPLPPLSRPPTHHHPPPPLSLFYLNIPSLTPCIISFVPLRSLRPRFLSFVLFLSPPLFPPKKAF